MTKIIFLVSILFFLSACDKNYTSERKYVNSSDIRIVEENGYVAFYDGSYTRKQLMLIYFLETFFQKYLNEEQMVQRITSDPYFWFSKDYNSVGAIAARKLIAKATETLTNGQFTAHFLTDTDLPHTLLDPEDEKTYIEVTYEAQDSAGEADWKKNKSGRVYAGQLVLSPWYSDTTDPDQLEKMRLVINHELGHVLGNANHSGLVGNVMTYNNVFAETNTFSDYELDAWKLYFSLPIGTLLSDIKKSAEFTTYIDPIIFPKTIEMEGVGLLSDKLFAKAGDIIIIRGSNFFTDFGCDGVTVDDLTVTLNGTKIDLMSKTNAVVTSVGSTCKGSIRAQVPTNASTGNLVISRAGKSSPPIKLSVK